MLEAGFKSSRSARNVMTQVQRSHIAAIQPLHATRRNGACWLMQPDKHLSCCHSCAARTPAGPQKGGRGSAPASIATIAVCTRQQCLHSNTGSTGLFSALLSVPHANNGQHSTHRRSKCTHPALTSRLQNVCASPLCCPQLSSNSRSNPTKPRCCFPDARALFTWLVLTPSRGVPPGRPQHKRCR